mmetsp:Transcript_14128/g.33373  ORF Transcript_14128/g.33373 Transcript_14128/m.33373 type:complete len:212 (+) Transcript_14128:1724-2359(+)
MLHSVHRDGSQAGTWKAMPRFSTAAVPGGTAPSHGKTLTGSASPSCLSIGMTIRSMYCHFPAVSLALTAWLTRRGGGSRRKPPHRAGTSTLLRCGRALSTTQQFCSTTSDPLLLYVFAADSFRSRAASSIGITRERAKKTVCMTMLMRFPSPTSSDTERASMVYSRAPESCIWRRTCGRRKDSSSPAEVCRVLRTSVPPCFSPFMTSNLFM